MKPLCLTLVAGLVALAPLAVMAQSDDQSGEPTNLLAPLDTQQLQLPDLNGGLTDPLPFAPADSGISQLIGPQFDVTLSAQMTTDTPALTEGLSWRVFGTQPAENGELPLLATASGGSVTLALPIGEYLVHGSYGRAGGTKRLTVADRAQSETFILNAGGLRLGAVVGDNQAIDADQITFEISQEDSYGARSVILPEAEPDKVVRLSAGTYHVVSRYGFVNAIVRADIEVYAGKLTDATIRHKGAEATFKLVENEGGEALANTSWTVLTQAGDTLHQSVGAFPTIILAEGTYTAVARHKDRTFARDFTVQPGLDRDVEVRLKDVVVQAEDNKN